MALNVFRVIGQIDDIDYVVVVRNEKVRVRVGDGVGFEPVPRDDWDTCNMDV